MRVLQSFPEGRTTTNPYLVQLDRGLRQHVQVDGFSWWRALTAPYDVFHVHWPEILLQGRTPARALARHLLFALLLTRLRLRHTAVVRTLHNLRSHEENSPTERRLLHGFDRRTTLWIRLNPFTPLPAGTLERTIAHGDYREWYADYPCTSTVPGRLLYFGLIRPYKGIDTLIDCFTSRADAAAESATLRIVGQPHTPELARTLAALAAGDPRIVFSLGYASDETLAREIGEAELVVLPYQEMHNSGAALLALSLGRPVLVPRNVVTEALALEVGGDWVVTYPGALSPQALTDALAAVRSPRRAAQPELSARSWQTGVAAHVEAYECAVRAVRAR
ncbi:glycosyl transferase [Cryobacterium sp. Y11]|uniref:glycosyltransferase n=1 Tax=Cryobacterium sp. Y11 TaxID=2045016 RepID=UPI001E37E6EE|nr:glycosyl transferase [Cryobacterium sp. Y11]